jgi:hypothetical protein
MKKLNVENITYFDTIDSEYKAYILGLIYADGSINDKVKGKREWSITISIQEEDGYVLNELLDSTNKNKVKIYHPPAIKSRNWKKRAVARINNTYLCKSLVDLGCGPRKSQLGMKFPNIPENLIHHFIRGFFDGDGCVTINKRIYRGSTKTTEYFKFLDDVTKYLPITKVYKRSKLRTQIVHTYWIERVEDIANLHKYLYKDATVFFQRKYDKFNTPIKSQAVSTLAEGLETT